MQKQQNLKPKKEFSIESPDPTLDFNEEKKIIDVVSKNLLRNTATGEEIYVNGKWTSLGSGGYTDRGDPTAYDFRIADLTDDDTWRDLDLSSIVGSGAKAVALHMYFRANAVGGHIYFRKKGNSNDYAISAIRTQVANVGINADLVVSLDSNGYIQYKTPSSTDIADICVKGWWT